MQGLQEREREKPNIQAIRVLKREEKEGKAERVLEEIIPENFPILAKGRNIQTQEPEKSLIG